MNDYIQNEESVEVWKDIRECSKYQASNTGNIKNKETNTILKPGTSGWGYLQVNLYYDSKHHTRYVHKLIAETFIPNPDNKPKVNHINGIKTDNRVCNLEWVTNSENEKHAYDIGLKSSSDKVRENAYKMGTSQKTRQAAYDRHPDIRIVETGEIFESNKAVAEYLDCKPSNIYRCLYGKQKTCRGLHLEYVENTNGKPFLYDFQMEAVKNAFNGSVFNGDVGSGKSRTGLFYYFKEQGGWIDENGYIPMKNPKDLYIITTAMKRDKKEWFEELIPFQMYPKPELNRYDNKIVIDSWNNIKKYVDVKDAFFIWDEQRVVGTGAWVKSFLKITKNNDWVMLSATVGDTWLDYVPLFIANGFYKNRTDFIRQHVEYDPFCKNFPKVKGYHNTGRLIRLRNKILIDMDFKRPTVRHNEDVYCQYDIAMYKDAIRNRWDPYKGEPIQQASGLCYVLRKIVNSDESRQVALLELLEDHPKSIIFYSFDYERDILLNLGYSEGTEIAEWSGHAHQPIPTGEKWVYLVNYQAGAEGWNTITTDTIIFYSQNYSYKILSQASGRIDRLNTKFVDLYYYHLKTRSGIDLAISKALKEKKIFNEGRYVERSTNWFKE